MAKNKKKQGKSSPKGRGHVTRKTSRGSGIGKIASRDVVPSNRFVADEKRVRLRYTDQTLYAFSATGGAVNVLGYSLNGCNPVNFNTSSGSPQGWTLLSSEYSSYVVLNSSIRWRIVSQRGGAPYGSLGTLGANPAVSALVSATMYPRGSLSAGATSVKDASVQQYSVRRFDFPPEIHSTGTPSLIDLNAQNPRNVWRGRHSMAVQKLDGEESIRQPPYEALVSANPTNYQRWYFVFQDTLADTTAEPVFLVEVDIEYDVLMFNRKLVTDALVGDGLLHAERFVSADGLRDERKQRPRVGAPEEKASSPTVTVERYTVDSVDAVAMSATPRPLPAATPGTQSYPFTATGGDRWVKLRAL